MVNKDLRYRTEHMGSQSALSESALPAHWLPWRKYYTQLDLNTYQNLQSKLTVSGKG
jgi:hypothetical protein